MKMPLWTSLPQIGAKSHSARVWDTCNPGQATVFVGVWLRGLAMQRSRPTSHFATGCQLTAISLAFHLWLPKTPSELKTRRFRSFVRSWCDHDELSFVALFALVASSFRTRAALQAEILALGHQLAVFQKNAPPRLRFQRSDRPLWVLLSRWWPGWRRSLHIVRPETVIAWHRRAFAWYWTRKSRRRAGRPNVAAEIRNLIRDMSQANPLWGASRIHGNCASWESK